MILDLIEDIPKIVRELNEKGGLRTSELNLINGLIDAFEDIRHQVEREQLDDNIEDCLLDIMDALQHRLDCIINRENS